MWFSGLNCDALGAGRVGWDTVQLSGLATSLVFLWGIPQSAGTFRRARQRLVKQYRLLTSVDCGGQCRIFGI